MLTIRAVFYVDKEGKIVLVAFHSFPRFYNKLNFIKCYGFIEGYKGLLENNFIKL